MSHVHIVYIYESCVVSALTPLLHAKVGFCQGFAKLGLSNTCETGGPTVKRQKLLPPVDETSLGLQRSNFRTHVRGSQLQSVTELATSN